ncbi:MAG: WG repeat-containing protein [Anaerolineales bacterium]|nr:WG repeat-containing protein [Anaerolineales bacterium]
MRNKIFQRVLVCALAGLVLLGCSLFSSIFGGGGERSYQIRSADGSGIMDCNGEWLVGPVEREQGFVAGPLVAGLAPFMNLDQGYYTFIDQNGEFPFDQEFDWALPFSEGLAAVRMDEEWGFIDTKGDMVIEPQFFAVMGEGFQNDLAVVATKANDLGMPEEWVFIDPEGKQVLGPYRYAGPFSGKGRNLYAAVSVTGEQDDDIVSGFIDRNGEFVLGFTREERLAVAGQYAEGLFPVRDIRLQFEEERCAIGFMDQDGEWVIEPQFCEVGPFQEGLAAASASDDPQEREFGYIDTDGEFVIRERYDFAQPFSGGCALVVWDGYRNQALIDPQGKIIYEYEP